jgi:hypothetical protein
VTLLALSRLTNERLANKMQTRDLILTTILVCVAGLMVLPLFAQEDEINWLENYGEALREARRTGKPIFLEFRCEP